MACGLGPVLPCLFKFILIRRGRKGVDISTPHPKQSNH
uniref:Uncharacterized protein n=1 Tax=Anguilla anguilla TaxID=7936 RepID=A0A0E9R1G9_ANGAN